jgi:glycine dehydrogenase subunit 1
MDYIPHSEIDIQKMLKEIGIQSLDDLFKDIPSSIKTKVKLGEPLSEPDILSEIKDIGSGNKIFKKFLLGAGCYAHYRPAIVDEVLSRNEFYTSYTPYQPEISQGMLTAIFEYQTAMAMLTGLDVSNASMYDGSTAAAEAVILGVLKNKKNEVIVANSVHPEYIETVATYCYGRNATMKILSIEDIIEHITENTASVLIQNPDFFGNIHDLQAITKEIKAKNSKVVVIQAMTDMTALGILKKPSENGVDIFVGEGQSLGLPMNFGGPGIGVFCTTADLMRKIPGRLVGYTKSVDGASEGFILTLQTREQHIRRDKALSNICSNQALCMLGALTYLLALGSQGLKELAIQNIKKTRYLMEHIKPLSKVKLVYSNPVYNEFCVQFSNSAQLESFNSKLIKADICPPLRLEEYYPNRSNQALFCVTEMLNKEDLDIIINYLKEVAQ